MVRGSFYGSPSSSLTLIHCWRHWRKKLGCHHFTIHLLGVKVFDVTMSVSTSWCWEGNLRGLTKICSTDPQRTMNVKKKKWNVTTIQTLFEIFQPQQIRGMKSAAVLPAKNSRGTCSAANKTSAPLFCSYHVWPKSVISCSEELSHLYNPTTT